MISSIVKIYRLFEKRSKRHFLLLVFGSILSGIAEILALASIFPFILFASEPNLESSKHIAFLAQKLNLQGQQEILIALTLAAIGALVISNLYLGFITRLQIKFAHLQGHWLSYRLFRHYLLKPYIYFLDKNTNELAKNVLSEVGRVVIGVLLPSLQMLTKVVGVLAILSVLIIKEPLLSITSIGVLALIYVVTYKLVQRKLVTYGTEHSQSNEVRYKIVGDLLSGIKIIKLSSRFDYLIDRYKTPSLALSMADIKSQTIPQVVRYSLEIVVYGGMLVIALSLISKYGSLNASLPTLALFAFAGYRMLPAMQQIFNAISTIKYHHKAIELVYQGLNESQVVIAGKQQEIDLSQVDAIELNGVDFTYPNSSVKVLDGVTTRLPKHCTVGLVGQTGSGKTTMIDILLGLLIPQKGQIRFDHEAYHLGEVSYTSQVGYVPQDVFLIDDTIVGNIALGASEQDLDLVKVEQACQIAQIDDFIRGLPEGYNTHIGQMGVKLSGGQRQRLGIARALYFSPTLLVLDEATSALDSQTELKFLEALKQKSNVRFIIMIAHRLASIKHCDLIYYLQDGQVASAGSFEALKQGSDEFRALTQQQSTA